MVAPSLPAGLLTGGPDLCVALIDDRGTWSLVAEDGVLAVTTRPPRAHELVLRRATPGSIFELLTASANGAQHAGHVMVSRPGHTERPHPPFDVEPEGDNAPELPSVDVTIQFRCFDSPLGDLHFVEEFVDGRLTRRSAGMQAHPDVTVSATFELLMRGYDPHITSLEAITGMHVTGDDRTLLMVVAGLYDSRRFRHHLWRRHREQGLLVALAQHTRTDVWREAIEPLR